MRITLKVLLALCIMTLACSCSLLHRKGNEAQKTPAAEKAPAAGEVASPAGETAGDTGGDVQTPIRIRLSGDRLLNLHQNLAHTLAVCIYQLKDPNGFNQRSETEDGITALKNCIPFDATVANAKMAFVQPGAELSVVRERAEGARYLGLVAGYSSLRKERVLRLVPIPSKSSLRIEVSLGQNGIANFRVK